MACVTECISPCYVFIKTFLSQCRQFTFFNSTDLQKVRMNTKKKWKSLSLTNVRFFCVLQQRDCRWIVRFFDVVFQICIRRRRCWRRRCCRREWNEERVVLLVLLSASSGVDVGVVTVRDSEAFGNVALQVWIEQDCQSGSSKVPKVGD